MCRAESPTIEQFAREHGDQIRVVGMGAQDSLAQAEEFVATGGLESPFMIWDTGFDSWAYYGITGQPTAVLVEASGDPVAGWRGFINVDEVLELAAEL